ncbi:hypothetical protein VTI74DRAFT_2775 [Chaetomium olivicolor]
MVEGSHGSVVVIVAVGLMLVTPPAELLGEETLLRVVEGVGTEVSGGTVLLPLTVGMTVPLSETDDEVTTGGSCDVADVMMVELVPGTWVEVADSEENVVRPVPVDGMLVEFEIGGCSLPVEVSIGRVEVVCVAGGSVTVVGGSVAVAVSVVETPVPGPVMPLVGSKVNVALCDGSRMLDRAELILSKTELIGSTVLDTVSLVVTMPVGARRIEDVDVEAGSVTTSLLDASVGAADVTSPGEVVFVALSTGVLVLFELGLAGVSLMLTASDEVAAAED